MSRKGWSTRGYLLVLIWALSANVGAEPSFHARDTKYKEVLQNFSAKLSYLLHICKTWRAMQLKRLDATECYVQGAWLDPSDPKAPFGATVKNPEGEPVAERMGPVDDPYSIAIAGGEVTTTTGVTTAMDEDSILGDGSLVGAEAAIEAICHAVDVSVAKV
ncbi:hypothetical protein Vafri_17857 [Volvox africanus]|uniref:Uncharacterized protein n=1 Tax=Volvox africanus TaxID=51714 RepID=A0A8J4BM31_9CHLO|nr:hypothetical protein Vafri_17857 [Volvox africanus]